MNKKEKQRPNFLLHTSLIFLTALAINYVWEMLQMPFYEEMRIFDLKAWLFCFQASVVDALITLFIYMIGRLLFNSWSWHSQLSTAKIIYIVLIGTAIAVPIEIAALTASRWSYSSLMPKISSTIIGIIPVVQLIVLPYICFSLASKVLSKQK